MKPKVEFLELISDKEWEDAFDIIKELTPQLNKADFLQLRHHELQTNHKLFGLKLSGNLVSVAAVWVLINGLLEKLMWICGYVTTASKRSKGYGKILLLELEDYAKRKQFHEIRVHTHRDRAFNFWKDKAKFEPFSHVLRKKLR